MAYYKQNIIIGAAAVFMTKADSTQVAWGASGPNLPGFTANTTAVTNNAGVITLGDDNASTGNWRHAGFTSEGVEVSYEPDYGDVQVDQLLDAAKLFKQSMRVSVKTTLTEATLENLMISWGQQASTLTGSADEGILGITSGQLGEEPTERGMAFVGPGPRVPSGANINKKRERLYHVRRALSVEASSHSLKRSEATMFPVSFRLLPDASYQYQEYGTVRDRLVS